MPFLQSSPCRWEKEWTLNCRDGVRRLSATWRAPLPISPEWFRWVRISFAFQARSVCVDVSGKTHQCVRRSGWRWLPQVACACWACILSSPSALLKPPNRYLLRIMYLLSSAGRGDTKHHTPPQDRGHPMREGGRTTYIPLVVQNVRSAYSRRARFLRTFTS